jgi:lipopolysaccharide export LptBFGC system permease protein LptF
LKIIEKYLIFEWLKWFCLCFLVLYSLLFLQLLSEESKLFASDSFPHFIILFSRFGLSYLSWLLPIGCFVATLFTFSFLAKNRELLALDTSGCSTFFIIRPIIGLAIGCCFFSWLCQDTEKLNRLLERSLDQQKLEKNTQVSSFKMRLKSVNRTWHFQSFNIETEFAEKIHLYSYDDQGNELFRIRAESGNRSDKGWQLLNGNFLGFSSPLGIPIIKDDQISWDATSERFDMTFASGIKTPKYNKQFLKLNLSHIHDDPEPFALLRTKPQNLSFERLTELIECFPHPNSPKLHPYRLRRAQLLWNVPGCFLAVMCAFALTLRKEHTSIGFIIGLSLLWILVFYIIKSFCDALGEKGILSDWVATGIPFMIVFAISIKLLCGNR